MLQRHLAKAHSTSSSSDSEEEPKQKATIRMDIDSITGKSYVDHAKANAFQCPYPDLPEIFAMAGPSTSRPCAHFFRRAYDLRRHMRSEHRLDVEKELVDEWVKGVKH